MTREERTSDALHARVQRWGRAALAHEEVDEDFEALALAIAHYQYEHNPVLRRLGARCPPPYASWHDVPAVPADAFRLGRVAGFAPEAECARFQTSGTTGGAGIHGFRRLDTYRELSVLWGRQMLLGGSTQRFTVLGLAAPFEPERRSSLGFMMQEFMRALDGRALGSGGDFEPLEAGRWLVGPGALNRPGLQRGVELAVRRGEPVLLLSTSFALAWLLEALGEAQLPLPAGSVVMQTGGFKTHARTFDDAELAARVCRALSIPPRQLIGEYGMTELGSQLYDGGFGLGPGGASVFVEPPWLRVTPVDPITFRPVPDGELGLARFTDLINVDSALVVLTQDWVRRVAGGIVLSGRRPGARLRGCSLAVEALAGAGGAAAAPPGDVPP